MGIFHEQVKVFNRAPIALRVQFDGQTTELPVGESSLPKLALEYAKRQNSIMGTADPDNPSMSGASYLIGVVGRDECTPLTKGEWEAHLGAPCRLDLELFSDERLGDKEHFEVRGRGKRTQAANRSAAHAQTPAFERDAE